MERKYFIILTILWVVFITTLSLISFSDNAISTFQNSDKIVHFTFYFILSLLLLKSINITLKHKYLIVISIAVFFGIIIEALQDKFTLTRKADFYDVVANTLGAISAVLVSKHLLKSFFSNISKKN